MRVYLRDWRVHWRSWLRYPFATLRTWQAYERCRRRSRHSPRTSVQQRIQVIELRRRVVVFQRCLNCGLSVYVSRDIHEADYMDMPIREWDAAGERLLHEMADEVREAFA